MREDGAGPIVDIRVVSSDREWRGAIRTGELNPYVAGVVLEDFHRARPGAWIEVAVPRDVTDDELTRLTAQLSPLTQAHAEVVICARRTA